MIVAFEGVDGSGKSHHSKALRGRLMNDGFSVFCGHCPKGTDIGRFLYSRMDPGLDNMTNCLMMMASINESVSVAQASGADYVIFDRFLWSNIAYHARSYEDILYISEVLHSLRFPVPDIVVYLDVPPSEASRRVFDRGEVKSLEKESSRLAGVSGWYRSIMDEGASPVMGDAVLVIRPDDRCIEDVEQEIYSRVISYKENPMLT